jgi:hypothetical protein
MDSRYYILSMLTLAFIFVTISNFKKKVLEGFGTEKADKEFVIKSIENAMKTIKPAMRGVQGPQGRQGPSGKDGGVFVQKGPLRSIEKPELFLDRNRKKLKLGLRSYKPTQNWTLSSDGKLKNSTAPYPCLHYNNKGILEMKSCPSASKWEFDENLGQLKTMSGKEKCLTMENNKSLSLHKCDNKPAQAWSFH